MSFADKVEKATEVYNRIVASAVSLEEDNIGACLAYLMGAILQDDTYDMWESPRYQAFNMLLYEAFPEDHWIWLQYIRVQRSNDCHYG